MQVNETPQHVKDELLDNETIVWIGKPNPKSVILIGSPFLLMGVLVAANFIKELLDGFARHLPVPFNLFSCIGLLFAIFILSAPVRFWFRVRSTYYVVTDRRFLVITGDKNRKVESYDKKSLQPMLSINVWGMTNLCWSAPGTHTDSDGDIKQNTVWFSGINPRDVYQITSDSFPKLSELGKNLPR